MALPGFLQIPGTVNFTAGRNGIFRVQIQYALNQVGQDITGCAFRMQTRKAPGDATIYTGIDTITPTASGSKITIKDAPNGWFELYLSNTDLQLIPTATPVSADVTVFHDIVLFEPGFTSITAPVTDYYRIANGTFTLNEGVTR